MKIFPICMDVCASMAGEFLQSFRSHSASISGTSNTSMCWYHRTWASSSSVFQPKPRGCGFLTGDLLTPGSNYTCSLNRLTSGFIPSGTTQKLSGIPSDLEARPVGGSLVISTPELLLVGCWSSSEWVVSGWWGLRRERTIISSLNLQITAQHPGGKKAWSYEWIQLVTCFFWDQSYVLVCTPAVAYNPTSPLPSCKLCVSCPLCCLRDL